MDIQSETHNSIEDAHTALLVYKKYKELQANNTFNAGKYYFYNMYHKR